MIRAPAPVGNLARLSARNPHSLMWFRSYRMNTLLCGLKRCHLNALDGVKVFHAGDRVKGYLTFFGGREARRDGGLGVHELRGLTRI